MGSGIYAALAMDVSSEKGIRNVYKFQCHGLCSAEVSVSLNLFS